MESRNTISPAIGLILLFLMSGSVMLSTIFYLDDKALVIVFNSHRSYFGDLFWLSITNSAGLIAYGIVGVSLIRLIFVRSIVSRKNSLAIAMAGGLSAGLATLVKYGVARIRPYHLFTRIHELGPGGGWSFPSGHTCDAFFLAAILTIIYPQKRWLILSVYIWAFLVGMSRVYLGAHYPSDVLAGVAIGSTSSILAWWITDRAFYKKHTDL